MSGPRVAIGPGPVGLTEQAVLDGGGIPVGLDEPADALVWLDPHGADDLRAVLDGRTDIRWVQLPWAGVEAFAGTGLFDDRRTWSSAKGSFAEPVAEHALALALAGLRLLPERITAKTWGEPAATSLYDQDVTIVGGGGIAERLLEQLAPFRVRATVVRRRPDPVPGAARTVTTAELRSALPGALVVFLALALTPDTANIIGAGELALMDRRAWLVNVARGGHVDTDALLTALRDGSIAGAALDVTNPEPLPDGHPLWTQPNCIITPHTADTPEMIDRLRARRVAINVRHFAAGESIEGLVDPSAGY